MVYHQRPVWRILLVSLLITLPLIAAPERPQRSTANFSAEELAQGYTNQSVLALPRAAPGQIHDAQAETACAEAETAEGFVLETSYSRFDGLRVLRVPEGMTPALAIERLLATGRYAFVEVDQIVRSAATPSDPSFIDQSQWHHHNTGQNGGIVDADINATAAWDIRNDASTVIVAIVDSGARLTHQDIAPNLWVNPREIAGNGIDDDLNGYVDDVHGIDARLGTGNPLDPPDYGHGTHVTGIIGGAANNNVGGTGVAWRVKLMPLLFLGGPSKGGTISDEIECIDYAIANGAKVINASFGSNQFSQAEFQAIERARDADIVFVCAVGNSSRDLDLADHFPVGHPLDNIVGVANSDRFDQLFRESNRSSGMVDLAAPGTEILSLASTGDTATVLDTGTSMSAPMVTGAVALLRAQFPNDTYRDTINRLLRGTRRLPAFSGLTKTGGRLDLAAALTTFDVRPFNDDFNTRAILQGEVVRARASSVNATAEAGEPAHAGRLSRSLWFSWTAPSGGSAQIDTTGSVGDTQLSIYTGDTLPSLTLVADNDNESGSILTSRVAIAVTGGTTYHIATDGTAAGFVALNISLTPANDAFAHATIIDPANPFVRTSNATASRETGEPEHLSNLNGQTLWYRWTAPHSGSTQISARSLSDNPALAVYTGSSLGALNAVGSSQNTGVNGANFNALVAFNATAGTTYSIALDTSGATRGNIDLSVSHAVWQFTTGNASSSKLRQPFVDTAPVIGPDGTIYASSSDRYVYAINPDGSLRWRVLPSVDTEAKTMPISPLSLAADGTLHFGTNAGIAYALNVDGSTRWSSSLGSSPYFGSPAIAADGTSYYKQFEGALRAFSADGAPWWTYTVAGPAKGGDPVIASDGAVIFPANDGALHAINPSDGTRRWRFQPTAGDNTADTSGVVGSPAIDASGNLYAASAGGTVFSVNASGGLRWIYRTTGALENVSTSLAVGQGRAVFASHAGYLYALDQATGSEVWRTSLGGPVRSSSPAMAEDGSIFVGTDARTLWRVSADGELLQKWSAGERFRSAPVLANGRVTIGSHDGKVYTFDLAGLEPASGPSFPWPQYRHGPRRLGRATIEVIGRTVDASPLNPGRLVNLSVRNRTTRGVDALIAGFVLEGAAGKPLVVRGIGPALNGFGVENALAETTLEIFDKRSTSVPIAFNSGWTNASGDGRELGAFSLTAGSADSVVRANFGSEPYTARVRPRTEATGAGVALVEIYDAATADINSRLTNLSARTRLAANSDVTVGFVITGDTPRTVLLRAIGPGLTKFEVPDALSDPRLILLTGQTEEVGNNDWRGLESVRAAAETGGAFPLDNLSADAAFITTLPPGPYTARVTAANQQSGIVLIEVYLLPTAD